MTTIDFSGPLAHELREYLAMRQVAGGVSWATVKQLRTLDRFSQSIPLPSRTIDERFARAWLAPCEARGPNTRRGRYFLLRRFCLFLVAHRPDTFVPSPSLCPRRRPVAPPHIYTREEIRLLLDEALRLRDWDRWHPCPIRSHTMHTIFLLLATTGLRISEALHLPLKDVDLDRGVLTVRQSKFRKSRLVPVSTGTLAVLCQYAGLRCKVAAVDPEAAFFVSGRQRAYSYSTVNRLFQHITTQVGIRTPTGGGPRLHDLRHTFAITRLLLWYREGANVMARLPRLTTYLGHTRISDTEVYLQATTELLAEASQRFHHFAADTLPQGGRS